MKKFLIATLLFLGSFSAAHAQSTATVTGHTMFPSGGAATNASVCFSLQNFKPNVPRVTSTGVIVQQQNWCIVPAADGSFSTTLDRNDFITPIGTYWRVDFLWNGLQQSSASFLVNKTPFNVDTETPLSQIPVVGPNQIVTQTFPCPQFSASTTWVCVHGFNDSNVQVQTFDSNGHQIFPDTLTKTDANTVTITFVSAQSGFASVYHGGSIAIATNQPNAVLQNPTGAQVIGGPSLTITAPLMSPLTLSGSGTFTGSGNNGNLLSLINSCNPQAEWTATQGGTAYPPEAVTGCITGPNGQTNEAHAIGGYATTVSENAVGGYFQARCLGNNTFCSGSGNVVQDVAGLTTGVVLHGLDTVVAPLNAPSTYGTVIGDNYSLFAPTAGAFGHRSFCGLFAGSVGTWGDCFGSADAATSTFFNAGIQPGAAPNPSQVAIFQHRDGGGTKHTNQFFVDTSGQFNLNSTLANIVVQKFGVAPKATLAFDANTAQRTYTFPDVDGAIVVDTATQSLSNKTLVSPVISGATTGSGVQGTDSKLLTSGTVSGTGTVLCTDANGGATTTSCGNQATFTDGSISGNVTINNTATNVKAVAVTFPSGGCPCRAFISYSLYLDFTGITNQANIDFWVDDGNGHVMAGVETGQSNASTGARTSASYGGFSTVTYTNSAAVTFTLKGIQPGTAGATVQASPHTGSGPNSDFQVTVFPSVN
jgi:hypothetical protein